MPPVIAITAPLRSDEGSVRVRLGLSYPRAVEHAGALPVLVAPLLRNDDAGRIMDSADALLLTGGEDVEPSRYGAAPHPTVTSVSAERDATEIALVEAARQRGKPVLAICRGIQLLNVPSAARSCRTSPASDPGRFRTTRRTGTHRACIRCVWNPAPASRPRSASPSCR